MIYDELKNFNPVMAFFAALASATTTTGEEISIADYESAFFAITAPVLATGTYAPKVMARKKSDGLYEELTNTLNLSGVPSDATKADKITNATLSGASDAKKTTKIGVLNIADKYDRIRLDIVSTGTVSGTISAVCVLGHARNGQGYTQKI